MIPICHLQTASIMGDEQRTMLDILDQIDASLYESHVVCPEGGPLNDALADRGAHVHTVRDLSPTLHGWRDAKAFWSLKGILERERIRLLHNHTAKGRLLGTLAARRAHVPWIVNHVHGFAFHAYASLWKSFALKRVEARIAKMATTNLLVNHHDRKLALAQDLMDEHSCHTIYNGTHIPVEATSDAEVRTRFRRAHHLADRDVGVVVAMPLDVEKQPLLLPEIAASLARRELSRHWRMLILGDGPQRAMLKSTIRTRGLSKHVVLVDAVWRQHILGGGDVVLQPSLREGLPLTLIEALAARVPVVASDIAGNREVVPRNTGFLVEPRDPEDYAEKLAELIENPLLRQRLGQAGRERAVALFDAQVNIPQVIALYDQLTAARPAILRQAA